MSVKLCINNKLELDKKQIGLSFQRHPL